MPCGKRHGQGGSAGKGQGQCRRRGKGPHGSESGPVSNCICPNCGTVVPKQPGIPCRQINCPKCGTQMMRE